MVLLCYNAVMDTVSKLACSDKVCAATGHRILTNPEVIWDNLDDVLQDLIEKDKYEVFLSGMAVGFDTLFAQKVLSLKTKYPHIKLVCVLPCRDQSSLWRPSQVADYYNILGKADEVICLSEKYNSICMAKRNKFLVDNSSRLIAYYVRKSRGTKMTVDYAMNNNKVIHFISDV